jgi:hypothetical protein
MPLATVVLTEPRIWSITGSRSYRRFQYCIYGHARPRTLWRGNLTNSALPSLCEITTTLVNSGVDQTMKLPRLLIGLRRLIRVSGGEWGGAVQVFASQVFTLRFIFQCVFPVNLCLIDGCSRNTTSGNQKATSAAGNPPQQLHSGTCRNAIAEERPDKLTNYLLSLIQFEIYVSRFQNIFEYLRGHHQRSIRCKTYIPWIK